MVNLLKNYLKNLKNLYGRFWILTEGYKEYYLKVDGYYFCIRKNKIFLVIRVRNKRTVDILPILDIINDKNYLKELHPVDACIIGILANNERNGMCHQIDNKLFKIKRFKENRCLIKSEPILYIEKKYTNKNIEITVLRSKYVEEKLEIPTIELYKNQALLYALDTFQAISVGYDVSEAAYKK